MSKTSRLQAHAASPLLFTARPWSKALTWAVSLGAVATLALVVSRPAHAAADTALPVTPAQAKALGLVASAVGPASRSTRRSHPARVTVPPTQDRVVAAPAAGLVLALHVQTGDSVRAGQVLAVLHSPQAADFQREVRLAQSQAELAAATLARDEKLQAEGLIANARLEASRAAARQAQVQWQDRQQALAALGGAPQQGQPQLQVLAPIAGVVLESSATVGQRLEMSAPLFRVAALATLRLELQVPVAEAGAVRLGDKVWVAGLATPGQVVATGQVVDAASQTVTVRADVRNTTGPQALRVGQAVEAALETQAADVVQVPAAAVVDHQGREVVFLQNPAGQYRTAAVTTRGRSGAVAYVSGLAADARVVVQGTAALKALLATP